MVFHMAVVRLGPGPKATHFMVLLRKFSETSLVEIILSKVILDEISASAWNSGHTSAWWITCNEDIILGKIWAPIYQGSWLLSENLV